MEHLGWLTIAMRLAMAMALGACVGIERELADRTAGFRTHSLVALGAAAFGTMSLFDTGSPSRIAAQVVTGVGFLIHVYAIGYMHGDPGFWRFFSYLNLFIFAMGSLSIAAEPIVKPGVPPDLLHYTDPMPQALVLTAIVITLSVAAFVMTMAYRSFQLNGDDEVSDDVEDRRIRELADRMSESDDAQEAFNDARV